MKDGEPGVVVDDWYACTSDRALPLTLWRVGTVYAEQVVAEVPDFYMDKSYAPSLADHTPFF